MQYPGKCTNVSKKRFEVYDMSIEERFHKKYTEEGFTGPISTNLTMEMWSKLAEDDEDFQFEVDKVFYNPSVREVGE